MSCYVAVVDLLYFLKLTQLTFVTGPTPLGISEAMGEGMNTKTSASVSSHQVINH